EGERDRRRNRRAEDEHENDQQERQGDQLAAVRGVDALFLNRAEKARVPGLGGDDGGVNLLVEEVFEVRHRLVHRGPGVDVEVSDDQCLVRLRTQTLNVAGVPG